MESRILSSKQKFWVQNSQPVKPREEIERWEKKRFRKIFVRKKMVEAERTRKYMNCFKNPLDNIQY